MRKQGRPHADKTLERLERAPKGKAVKYTAKLSGKRTKI